MTQVIHIGETVTSVEDIQKLLLDVLEFLETQAVEDGWFEGNQGWKLLNNVRATLDEPSVEPVDNPEWQHFDLLTE